MKVDIIFLFIFKLRKLRYRDRGTCQGYRAGKGQRRGPNPGILVPETTLLITVL